MPRAFGRRASTISEENSVLLLALSGGRFDHAKNLIRDRPRLASVRINQHGYTVMHFICEFADAAIVKEVVGIEPYYMCSPKDSEKRTPLHIAAEIGKEEVLKALVTASPGSIKELNSLAETALHVALKNHHCRCFQVLMEQLQRLHFRSMELLINRQDFEGNTVLHIATGHKQVQIVKALVSCKHRNGERVVDVNSTNHLDLTALDIHCQKISDRKDKEISDILHEARAKKGHELGRFEGQPVLANMDSMMKISLVLAMFIYTANAAYDNLFDLSNIYPLDQQHVEILTISFSSPDLVPDVFYVIMANTIAFLGSMVVILVHTWSMAATKCSLCYRALPLLVTGAMLVSYVLAAKKIMPNFWITIGPHKIPSFRALWFFDLTLLFSALAAWFIGKQIFHKISAK